MSDFLKETVKLWVNENFSDLKLKHIDDEKFILKFEDKSIKVSYENLFKEDLSEMLGESNIETYKINRYMKRDDLDLSLDNSKLKKVYATGLKYGDYAEYFIEYEAIEYYNDWNLTEFNIGEIEVRVGTPSELFQLIFKQLEDDKYLGEWEDNITISLKGINSENYKSIIQEALFYIAYTNPSIYEDGHPRIRHFKGKYYNCEGYEEEEADEIKKVFEKEIEEGYFKGSEYVEVIGFYNLAVTLQKEEIAFLYFYKILEYFFIINHKKEFENIIQEYNNETNIGKLISEVSNIYKQKEENLLEYLLNSIYEEIKDIILEAFEKKLIKENTLENFSIEIYMYRNSIVHGKGDYRYSLKLPDDIDNHNEIEWNKILRKISEKLIFKYCIKKDE